MARLMSQVKGGYYAAAPEAITAVLERLRPPESGECLVLDPCAGEGKALVQLARGLKAVPYGIELSEDRAARVNGRQGPVRRLVYRGRRRRRQSDHPYGDL